MIVLVDDDDGDDEDGVEYSHAIIIIINNHLGLLSLSLSLSLDELQSHQTTKSNMSCCRPIPKPPLGYLIHVIACPHWVHASTCREQASEPAINSST